MVADLFPFSFWLLASVSIGSENKNLDTNRRFSFTQYHKVVEINYLCTKAGKFCVRLTQKFRLFAVDRTTARQKHV